MATRLSKLKISSVDSVDKGANQLARVIFSKCDSDFAKLVDDCVSKCNGDAGALKSLSEGAGAALAESTLSILTDRDIVDKSAYINQQLNGYNYLIGRIEATKGATIMDQGQQGQANLINIAKAAVATGTSAGLRKVDVIDGLNKIGDEIRKSSVNPLSREQAFVRAMETENGRLLKKALPLATGSEVAPPPPEPRKVPETGPAGKKMQALADHHLKLHPELAQAYPRDGGKAAAYGAVYGDVANHDLKQECLRENMAKSLAALA